jgi:hypothetical protein
MVTERHTGENTANKIRTIAREFGITDQKVSAIVTDNAANMVVCCQHLDWIHVRCFGHTLQLSIRKGFDNSQAIKGTITSCKKIVKHFRKSVVVSNALAEKQRQMGVKENSLVIDCETRWNSTYDMFDRFIEQQLPVYAVLHDPNFTKIQDARSLNLTEEQMKVIEGLVPVLKPLYMATTAMCSEEYPTVGGVYPILFSLINHHLNPNAIDIPEVSKFKADVRADIVSRHKLDTDEICSSVGMICTFLDPRYRSLPFLSNQQRQMVYSKVRELMGTLDSPTTRSGTVDESKSQSACAEPGPSKRAKLNQDDMIFLLGGYFGDCEIITPSNASEELDMYKNEKPVSSKCNPFTWWKENSVTYPTMAALARKLTCVPATSVPSERVFSLAGGTVTKLRASLDPDSVDKLVFVHKLCKGVKLVPQDVSSVSIKQEFQIKTEPLVPVSTPVLSTEVQPLPELPQLPQ